MKRLKIALLVAQADEEYQSEFVSGAMKKALSDAFKAVVKIVLLSDHSNGNFS